MTKLYFILLLGAIFSSKTILTAQTPAKSSHPSFNSVHFDSWKNDVNAQGMTEIDRLARYLKDNPTVQLEIVGHTDIIGSPSANLALSEQRAQIVLDAIVKKGVAKERLTSRGMGSSKPIAGNDTAEGRKRNRRVEFVLL